MESELPNIKTGEESVIVQPHERTVLAESSRILCSNIKYLLPKKTNGDANIILSTSSIKGEGKTFCAVNLSLALAALEHRVLLIGCDLRNPQLHKFVNLEKNISGLSNYLVDNNVKFQDYIIDGFTKYPTHDILLAGPIPPNPVQLLSNGNFEILLDEVKKVYDYIILDTAPSILVTDTHSLFAFADLTTYILRANYSEKNILDFPKNLIESKKIKKLAFILNDVGQDNVYGYAYRYGYSYGYKYNYGYGYGYGASED